ncbi:hypothetical protein KJ909_02735, partial [Patescibacteria group bacterium]|nr:hypothetical protein [Patescibacteria group bacterium]
FFYIKPGRTFDLSRPKVSPYIQIAGENRLLLEKGENVREKMEEMVSKTGDFHLGGARKHLQSICRLYESIYGGFGRIDLEDKLQAIIERSFGQN